MRTKHSVGKPFWSTVFFRLTSGVSWLCQAFDVKGTSDVVLYGGLVTPNHMADGFSEITQIIEDLKGCANLGWVLIIKRKKGGENEWGVDVSICLVTALKVTVTVISQNEAAAGPLLHSFRFSLIHTRTKTIWWREK